VNRLPTYRRALENLLASGRAVVSSHELAAEVEVTPSQLRKDLSCFGTFGTAGVGYDVRDLVSRLDEILGICKKRPVLLVGVGNLGLALLNRRPIQRSGFEIVAACDTSPSKVGRVIAGVRCYSLEETPAVLAAIKISIAMLAVPPDTAQETADFLVKNGIRALVNFSPLRLRVDKGVLLEQVDFGYTLQKVAYYLDAMEEQQ